MPLLALLLKAIRARPGVAYAFLVSKVGDLGQTLINQNIYIRLLTSINDITKKLILDTDNKIWKKVLKYKINNNFKNNDEAVVSLIKKG